MRRLKLAIAFTVVAFAGINPAFAAGSCVTPSGSDDGSDCDISAQVIQVIPAPGEIPSVAFSNSTQTNYVKYTVTLTHYATRAEGFSQVKFVADTSVVNASSPGPANFVGVSAPTIANTVGGAALTNTTPPCVISTATRVECTFNFNPAFDGNNPQATITFDLTVQSPTGAPAPSLQPTLNITTKTSYTEASGSPEPEFYSLTGSTNLTVPDPTVVATYLPAPGTVTTGTTQGVLSCTSASDPNRWINVLKVPTAAGSVSVNLNPFSGAPLSANYFSTLAIPGQVFGDGIRWYSQDAASKLLVITQKRHKCTIGSGQGTAKDALIGLATKTYYKPDHVTYWPYTQPPIQKNPPTGTEPVFQRVPLCLVSGGPYLGEPCLFYEYIDAGRNLIRVFYANENGKYATD